MKILSIETSCDETSAAVVKIDQEKIDVVSNVVSSQTGVHKQYGGVVPEVAARQHADIILSVIEQALEGTSQADGSNIDLIAVTRGPGLVTSLLVGVHAAETLALGWEKPVVGVNHLEGHVLAPLIEHNAYPPKENMFPIVVLTASGGHTQIVLIRSIGEYEVLGSTIDDAAGEAFDKVGKMLGLPYLGGPEIDKLAAKGNSNAFDFPRPMLQFDNYEFSFSGLKTAVKYAIRDLRTDKLSSKQKQDIAASFQRAIVDVLIGKTLRACIEYDAKTVFVSGGVAANTELRERVAVDVKKHLDGVQLLTVDRRFSGDNAVMIGVAGYFEYLRQNKNPQRIVVGPKLRL